MTRTMRPVTEPSKCNSCRADVLWVRWDSGKRMPVDAVADNRPLPKGGEHGELVAEKFDMQRHGFGRNRYTSHFSSCPNADHHRRAR